MARRKTVSYATVRTTYWETRGSKMAVLIGPCIGIAVVAAWVVQPMTVWSTLLAVVGTMVATAIIDYGPTWDLSRHQGLAFVGLFGLVVTLFLVMVVPALFLIVDLVRLLYGSDSSLTILLALTLALDILSLLTFFLQVFGGNSERFA